MTISAANPCLGSASASALRITHADLSYAIGTWERHVIGVWRREIGVHGVVSWSRSMSELQKQHPGQRINAIAYLESDCGFDGWTDTFGAGVEALKRFQEVIGATAIVYGREGFWNSAMRGRFTAMHNESGADLPYSMHLTLAPAVEWLCQNGAKDLVVQPQALIQVVESLRRA